jgi:ABC-2 type transport system permease protein
MANLIRCELIKLRTTSLPLVLAAVAAALTVLGVAALVLAAGQPGIPPLSDPAAVRNVFGAGAQASMVALVLGIMSLTGEFRHQTATATFLATPKRGRVVAAKMAVSAASGFLLGLLVAVATVALALPLLSWRSAASLPGKEIFKQVVMLPLGFMMYAVLGVAVGALVRNQVAALIGALLWAMVIEAMVVAFAPAVGKFLPGGALSGMLQATGYTGGTYLGPALATTLLACYSAGFALAATRITLGRDIS